MLSLALGWMGVAWLAAFAITVPVPSGRKRRRCGGRGLRSTGNLGSCCPGRPCRERAATVRRSAPIPHGDGLLIDPSPSVHLHLHLQFGPTAYQP